MGLRDFIQSIITNKSKEKTNVQTMNDRQIDYKMNVEERYRQLSEEFPENLKFFDDLHHVKKQYELEKLEFEPETIQIDFSNKDRIIRKITSNEFQLFKKDGDIYVGIHMVDGKEQNQEALINSRLDGTQKEESNRKFFRIDDSEFLKHYTTYVRNGFDSEQTEEKFNTNKIYNYFKDCTLKEMCDKQNPEGLNTYKKALSQVHRDTQNHSDVITVDEYRDKIISKLGNLENDFTNVDKLYSFYMKIRYQGETLKANDVQHYLNYSLHSHCTAEELTRNGDVYVKFYKDELERKESGESGIERIQDAHKGRYTINYEKTEGIIDNVYQDDREHGNISFGIADCAFKYFLPEHYGSKLVILDLQHEETCNLPYYKTDYEILAPKIRIKKRLDMSQVEDVKFLISQMKDKAFFSFLDDTNAHYGSFSETISQLERLNEQSKENFSGQEKGKYDNVIHFFESIQEIRKEQMRNVSWKDISMEDRDIYNTDDNSNSNGNIKKILKEYDKRNVFMDTKEKTSEKTSEMTSEKPIFKTKEKPKKDNDYGLDF